MRSKYDPALHFRQGMMNPGMVGAYPSGPQMQGAPPRSKSKPHSAAHGSYEDHLEKAARLSSEMSQYNQVGTLLLVSNTKHDLC